jgi:hypothetical protein
MAGQILQQARLDAQKILSEGGFENDITITKGEEICECKGWAPVHHVKIDTDGQPINSRQAHVTVHEGNLTGLTVRNSEGAVTLRNAVVQFADVTGVVKKYSVKENFADDTIGVIVLILSNYVE